MNKKLTHSKGAGTLGVSERRNHGKHKRCLILTLLAVFPIFHGLQYVSAERIYSDPGDGYIQYVNGAFFTAPTHTYWILSGEQVFPPEYRWFRGYWRFNISAYSGLNVASARLHIPYTYGSGAGEGSFQLQHISDFGSLDASDWDINVKSTLNSSLGSSSVDENVLQKLRGETDNGASWFAVRIRNSVEDSDTIYRYQDYGSYEELAGANPYLEVVVACTSHSGCPTLQFCNSTGYCQEKLSSGSDCASKEYSGLSDDPVCASNHCGDDFDGVGEFCSEDASDCVSDGVSYDSGYELCSGDFYFKSCAGGVWGSQQDCDTTADYQTCNGGCGWQTQAPDSCSSGTSGGCSAPAWGSCNDCGEQSAYAGGCYDDLDHCATACGASCNKGDTRDVGERCTLGGTNGNYNDVYDIMEGCAYNTNTDDCYFSDSAAADTFKSDCWVDCSSDSCAGTGSYHWYDFKADYDTGCVDSGAGDYCAAADCGPTSASCSVSQCSAPCDSDDDCTQSTEQCSGDGKYQTRGSQGACNTQDACTCAYDGWSTQWTGCSTETSLKANYCSGQAQAYSTCGVNECCETAGGAGTCSDPCSGKDSDCVSSRACADGADSCAMVSEGSQCTISTTNDGYCTSGDSDWCTPDKQAGSSCASDFECSSGYCRGDGFDGSGSFCADSASDCVHDGVSYDSGFRLCTGNDYKACSSGSWGGFVDCIDLYDGFDAAATKTGHTFCGYYSTAQTCVSGTGGGCTGGATADCGSRYYSGGGSCGSGLSGCDRGCGAVCDSSSDYTWSDASDTCSFGCTDNCVWGGVDANCRDPGELSASTCFYGSEGCGSGGCTTPKEECAYVSATLDDAGNTCYYDAGSGGGTAWDGDYCSTVSGCEWGSETCPDYCIDDSDGGDCAQTTRTDPSNEETCYYSDSCANSGCLLGSNAKLRKDYCDFCDSAGRHGGGYSPPLTPPCAYTASGDCADDGTRYFDETQQRDDDCDGAGNTLIFTETLSKGDVWDSTSSPAYCNAFECAGDCKKAEFGSNTGGACVSGECACNKAPSAGSTNISPKNADQYDTITLSAVCSDSDGEGDLVSCGFDTDQGNAADVAGTLDASYGTGTEALCTAIANVTSTGDVEYRVWCEDGDEDGGGRDYGAWNRDDAIKRNITIGGSVQAAVPSFTGAGSKDVWFKRVITVSGSPGDGTPNTFSHTFSDTMPSGADYWKLCEGDTSDTDCTPKAEGSTISVSATVNASYAGTEHETILYRYDAGAVLKLGSWIGKGVGNDSRQDVETHITLTETVDENFVVDLDLTGTIDGETSCVEYCTLDDKPSDGGWSLTALAYGDWITYPTQCSWTEGSCNASAGVEHVTCALGAFGNSFTTPLNVSVSPPPLPSASWDCGDAQDDCNPIVLEVAVTDDTSRTFGSYDDVVTQSNGGWADNGSCSQHTIHKKYRDQEVTLYSAAGLDLNCYWKVLPEASYECADCSGTTPVPDGGKTLSVQEERYCNNPVAILPVPAQTAREDEAFTYDLNASDADGDTLTWSDNVPFGAIDSSTGVWSFTPINDDVGVHLIEVRVNDGEGSTDNEIWSLTVLNTNDPPTWNPKPQDQTIQEDTELIYDINASDIDGDYITYSLNDSDFTINSSTGLINWTPPGNYTGARTVKVSADDGTVIIHAVITVNVTPVNDSPTITAPIPDQNKLEDDLPWTLNLTGYGGDADGNAVYWSVSGVNETLLTVSVNPATNVAAFTPKINAWGVGEITFTLSDGILSTQQDITVTLSPVNDPPEMLPLPDLLMDEDSSYKALDLDDYVNDVDDADPNISWGSVSENINASIDPESHKLTLTPGKDWYGKENITLTATDSGGLSSSATLNVTVLNTPDPPALSPIEPQTVTVGERLLMQANASDPDPITLLQYHDDTPLFDIDMSTGVVDYVPDDWDVGDYTIKITVYDGAATDEEHFNLTVLAQVTTTTTTTTSTSTTVPITSTSTTLPITSTSTLFITSTTSTLSPSNEPPTTTLPGGLARFSIVLHRGWNLISLPIVSYETPPSCDDDVMNGNETGVDCGGECGPCPEPACDDGVQNGNETGVDCGGECGPCPVACSDGIQNGNETGVDCGGDCLACHCLDGIQNVNESGVDCGGECLECPPLPPWFTVSVSNGWNLLSIPANASNVTAEAICREISEAGAAADRVKRWDTASQSYVTHPCGSGFLDYDISPQKAYWVSVNGSATLKFSASLESSPIDLPTGWDLAAWTSTVNTTAENWSNGLGADTVALWTGSGYTYHRSGFEFNDFAVSPYRGYWVHKNGIPKSPSEGTLSSNDADPLGGDVPGIPYGIVGSAHWENGSGFEGSVNLTNSRTKKTISTQIGLIEEGSYEFDLAGLGWVGDNLTVTVASGNLSNSTRVFADEAVGSQIVLDIIFPVNAEESSISPEDETTTTTTTTSTMTTSTTTTSTTSTTTSAEKTGEAA